MNNQWAYDRGYGFGRAFAGAMDTAINVGDKVSGGKGGDYDEGRVERVEGGRAFVAWQSGVKTWTPLSELRRH